MFQFFIYQNCRIQIRQLIEDLDFLIPSFPDSKNLGSGVSIPYFFNVAKDKNFTFISRIYENENPLYMGQFHQAFENSDLISRFWLY